MWRGVVATMTLFFMQVHLPSEQQQLSAAAAPRLAAAVPWSAVNHTLLVCLCLRRSGGWKLEKKWRLKHTYSPRKLQHRLDSTSSSRNSEKKKTRPPQQQYLCTILIPLIQWNNQHNITVMGGFLCFPAASSGRDGKKL